MEIELEKKGLVSLRVTLVLTPGWNDLGNTDFIRAIKPVAFTESCQ